MRIMSFSQRWPELQQPEFTTFRYPRHKDWEVGEHVLVFYEARGKERQLLGIAEIIKKELQEFDNKLTLRWRGKDE